MYVLYRLLVIIANNVCVQYFAMMEMLSLLQQAVHQLELSMYASMEHGVKYVEVNLMLTLPLFSVVSWVTHRMVKI